MFKFVSRGFVLQLFECILIHLFFLTVDSEGIVKNLTVSKYSRNFYS